jgi:hypothetical protein
VVSQIWAWPRAIAVREEERELPSWWSAAREGAAAVVERRKGGSHRHGRAAALDPADLNLPAAAAAVGPPPCYSPPHTVPPSRGARPGASPLLQTEMREDMEERELCRAPRGEGGGGGAACLEERSHA